MVLLEFILMPGTILEVFLPGYKRRKNASFLEVFLDRACLSTPGDIVEELFPFQSAAFINSHIKTSQCLICGTISNVGNKV